MLLVFFTLLAFGAGWRFARARQMDDCAPPAAVGKRPEACRRWAPLAWAVLAGVAVGFMHATKETGVIALAAMAGAIVLSAAWLRRGGARPRRVRHILNLWHAALFLAAALAVWFLFYSSFLANTAGPLDSFAAYLHYARRFGGEGSVALHQHPWHYYLRLLIYWREAPGPWWSEGLIVALALVGIVAALRTVPPAPDRGALGVFLAFYTLLLTAVYAAIPYKTPWNLLGFLHGMILMAGVGATALVRDLPRYVAHRRGRRRTAWVVRIIMALALTAGVWNLGAQAWRTNFRLDADPRNPYVYAHTARDFLRLVGRIETIGRSEASDRSESGGGKDRARTMLIKVYSPDYWPLPWYLRGWTRVGYWNEPPAAGGLDAPVIVASPDAQATLDPRLRDVYHQEYYALRPEVLLVLYIREDLWKKFMADKSTAS
jgi:hypothetical protein